MAAEEFKRKLTAILSADVEGYSRLMGEDEDATIRTLTTYRELMSTLIHKHRGRVVDSPGDNLLDEFGSVVDAVRCAVEIQEELRVRNAELPENRKMQFRIGINLGDVVEEGERIYGDGINIAARVEGLAEGGGICISGTVYDSIKNKLTLSYESIGEHAVKNIKEPVRVYRMRVGPEAAAHKEARPKRWMWPALAAVIALILVFVAVALWNFYLRRPSMEPASIERMAYPLPDKPSIAIPPFTNMSGDPDQEYIGDGLSENIISALSISSQILVIARNSTFIYNGMPVKVQQVAEELGVKYVLECNVQSVGDLLRITAQLIDALTDLWKLLLGAVAA
jgi:class 3 adenylate cyclase/TolB-like protein